MRRTVKTARAAKPARDAFTFSLGGIRTIAAYTAPTAIADDQMHEDRVDRGHCGPRPRRWLTRRRDVAISACS